MLPVSHWPFLLDADKFGVDFDQRNLWTSQFERVNILLLYRFGALNVIAVVFGLCSDDQKWARLSWLDLFATLTRVVFHLPYSYMIANGKSFRDTALCLSLSCVLHFLNVLCALCVLEGISTHLFQ